MIMRLATKQSTCHIVFKFVEGIRILFDNN